MITIIRNQAPFIALTLSMICIQFDSFAMSLALNSLVNSWDLDYSETQLIISVYLVGVGLSMLPAGIASDFFNHKKILLIGTALFAVSTLVCFLAEDFSSLVCARVFQGISAGMIVPSGISYITLYYPNFRTKLSIVMGIGYVAMSLGPSIGSYLISEYSWRSVFFVCLPLIMLAMVLVIISSSPLSISDKNGVSIKSNNIISVTTFLKSIDMDFYVSIVLGSLFNILLLGLIFTYPILLMNVYSFSIVEAGNSFLLVAIFVAGGSLFAGKADKKSEFFNLYAVLVVLLLSALLYVFQESLTVIEFIASYSFLGLILGFANSLALIANQTILPKNFVGLGSGMFKTITTLAGAFGVALIGNIIDENLNQLSVIISTEKYNISIFLIALSVILMLKSLTEFNKIKNVEIGR